MNKIIQFSIGKGIWIPALFGLVLWTIWGNTALEQTCYRISNQRIPEYLDGFRIAQVSDLHNADLGKGNKKLLTMIREAKPDMIAITGDLLDCRKTDIATALAFVEQAAEIAPCFYVPGNHETRIPEYPGFREELRQRKVQVLEDACCEWEVGGCKVNILGVRDPSVAYGIMDSETFMKEALDRTMPRNDHYSILLSHRPELFRIYAEHNIDLALTGHAHGGQFRLPVIGGLYLPGQGFFPKYDAGLLAEGNTHMVISRGIGNSIFPLRINNRPELVIVELGHSEDVQQ